MAQPSDLMNPVNGQPSLTMGQMFGTNAPAEPSLGQFIGAGRSPAAAPPLAPQQQTQPNPAAFMAAFDEPGAPSQGADPAAQFLAAFDEPAAANNFDRLKDEGSVFGPNSMDLDPNLVGEGAGVLARLRAGLGRSTAEKASLFEATFGKGNVKVRADKIYFRRPGEKRFQSVEPESLGFWTDLISDLADNSGSVVEGATAAGVEGLGALTGSAAGPAGAGLGLAAGAMVGGAAGADARRLAVAAAGGQIDPAVNQTQEQTIGAAANLAGLGAGALLHKVGDFAVKGLNRVLNEPALPRIHMLSRISAALDNMASEYRVAGQDKSAVGSSVRTAAQKERDILNNQVVMMRESVIEKAKDQKFPVTNTLSLLKKTLQEKGATFNESGNALLSGKLPDTEFSYSVPTQRTSSIVDASGDPFVTSGTSTKTMTIPGQPVREPLKPFGAAGGSPLMEQMASDYNRLLKEQAKGGVSAQELFDLTGFYQDKSSFDKDFGTKVTSQWKQLQHASADDRNMAAGLVLRGSPEEGAFTRAYQEFTDRTDALRQFEKVITKAEKNGGIGAIADAVINKEKPEKIARFKALFGDGENFDSITGPVWSKVKGEWLNGLIQKNTSASSGIFDGAGMLAELKSYGKETLNQVLSGEEQAALKRLSLKASSIKTSDLAKPEEFARDLLGLPFFNRMMASTKASILWKLTKRDARAAEYLLDEGFMDAARASTPDYRAVMLDTMQQYRNFYNAALRRKTATGREMLVDIPVATIKTSARATAPAVARDRMRPEGTLLLPTDEE